MLVEIKLKLVPDLDPIFDEKSTLQLIFKSLPLSQQSTAANRKSRGVRVMNLEPLGASGEVGMARSVRLTDHCPGINRNDCNSFKLPHRRVEDR